MHDTRINLRVDAELVLWAREYCKRKRISLSTLIRRLLAEERERDTANVEAEQI